jgi:hypothetical protein
MAMFNIAFGTVPNDGPNWKHHPHTLLNRYPVWAVISLSCQHVMRQHLPRCIIFIFMTYLVSPPCRNIIINRN